MHILVCKCIRKILIKLLDLNIHCPVCNGSDRVEISPLIFKNSNKQFILNYKSKHVVMSLLTSSTVCSTIWMSVRISTKNSVSSAKRKTINSVLISTFLYCKQVRGQFLMGIYQRFHFRKSLRKVSVSSKHSIIKVIMAESSHGFRIYAMVSHFFFY